MREEGAEEEVRTQNFFSFGGKGSDTGAVCNLCLILRTVL